MIIYMDEYRTVKAAPATWLKNGTYGEEVMQAGWNPAVVNMLRFVLGDELFWRAINHYVKKHAFQNVETQQLLVAIEEATGQNLQWFFDEWLYKIGHPEFEITSTYDEAAKMVKLSVKQTQKADEARPWFHSPEFFTMPVDVAITTASATPLTRFDTIVLQSPRTPFRIPATIWRKNASAGSNPAVKPRPGTGLELVVNGGSSTEREATMGRKGQTTCPS